MHFDLLFEWILNWVKVTPPLGGLGLQQRCLILLMMIHVMQNITIDTLLNGLETKLLLCIKLHTDVTSSVCMIRMLEMAALLVHQY